MLDFFRTNLPAFYIITTMFGLCIGSFLNVVIYRYPKMLRQMWHGQCLLFVNQLEEIPRLTLHLAEPRSFCPSCKKTIPFYRNIPLVSFLLQRGRCAHCHKAIAWRYPLIELASALLSGFIAYHYGVSWQMLAALILTWTLLVLAFIDIDYQLLPDDLVLPLLWLGLFCNIFHLFTDLKSAVAGAIAGYLILWLVAKLYQLCRKKEGMGHGDFKLLAMLGAWLGIWPLLLVVFLSAFMSVAVAIVLLALSRIKKQDTLPFGPYLALAGWITLIWGQDIMHWYLPMLNW